MLFDIRQLRYAITRALDIEQSTLSRAILKLELDRDTIFGRSRAGVT